jgi:hypothetical protein
MLSGSPFCPLGLVGYGVLFDKDAREATDKGNVLKMGVPKNDRFKKETRTTMLPFLHFSHDII